MKTKLIKSAILALIVILGITIFTSVPSFATVDACSTLKSGTAAWEAAGCGGSKDSLPNIITGILNAIIAISGLIAVIYVIIGGINYMTSTGDAAKVKKAKDTILYALIGLVICVLSFAIVNWVIIRAIGGQTTNPTNNQTTNPTNNQTTTFIIEEKPIAFLKK